MSESILPYRDYRLPSAGLAYRDKAGATLIADGVVKIRAMVGDEQAVVNNLAITVFEKIDRILNSCVQFPESFTAVKKQPKHLLMGDRLALLAAIRALTCGSKYQISAKCPQCRSSLERVVDLYTDLKITGMPRAVDFFEENGDRVTEVYEYNPNTGFSVEISTKQVIGMRLLDGFHEEFMHTQLRNDKSPLLANARLQKNPWFFLQRALSIRSITPPGGDERLYNHSDPRDLMDLVSIIGKMSATDLALLEETYEDYDIEIDSEYPVTCSQCTHESKLVLQFHDAEFFRATPTGRGGRRRA